MNNKNAKLISPFTLRNLCIFLIPEFTRKISDSKEQQTDLTFGHVNKKIQANTLDDDDATSDVDTETETASAASVSLRSSYNGGGDLSRYYRYKKSSSVSNPLLMEDVGFLNVAMHHLVQDELQAKRSLPKRRSRSQVDYVSDAYPSRRP